MKRTSKLLSILLSIAMLIAMLPAAAIPALATEEVSSWAELKEALSTASTNKDNPTEIKLSGNVYATGSDTFLLVDSGRYVVLDLNGYVLDRGLKEATADGYVLKVLGNLTVKDSQPGRLHRNGTTFLYAYEVGDDTVEITGGIITGGNNSSTSYDYSGGGVCVKGTFTLDGGTIANNAGIYGGGVDIDRGSFTMKNGAIIGNTAKYNGGGVYVSTFTGTGTFTMEGGAIIGNTAGSNGGGVYMGCSAGQCNISMTGGTISENTAYNGGGVFVGEKSEFTLGHASNAPSIRGNTADRSGGGVCVNNGVFTLTRGAVVKGNTLGGAANNVFLFTGKTIKIGDGGLTGAADSIGVTMVEPDVFTDGLGDDSKLAIFFSDDPTATKSIKQGTHEAMLSSPWSRLRSDLSNTTGTEKNPTEITLTADCNGYGLASGLEVPADAHILLDLNGFVIDRGLVNNDSGCVITILGDLRIKDSKSDREAGSEGRKTVQYDDPITGEKVTVTGGVITGGYNGAYYDGGGGLIVTDGGKLTLDGGTICGNRSGSQGSGGAVSVRGEGSSFTMNGGAISGNIKSVRSGGGVYVNGGGIFTMTGGKISGNAAIGTSSGLAGYGGGVNVGSGSKFYMTGGTITGNKVASAGGGVTISGDEGTEFNMTGGTITGNIAVSSGGGVYLSIGKCVLDGSEKAVSITGNTAGSEGGGVYVRDYAYSPVIFCVGGQVTVKDNKGSEESTSNVYLEKGKIIDVIGPLTGGADSIGVTAALSKGAITNGLAENGGTLETSAAAFFSEDPKVTFQLIMDEELGVPTPWSQLQIAITKGSKDPSAPTPIKLERDYAAEGEAALVIPAGTYIALDLNGHVIDRSKPGTVDTGYVIRVDGGLTVTDGGETPRYGQWTGSLTYTLTADKPADGTYDTFSTGGVITGGGGRDSGGGVCVSSGGAFTLTGGAITGNSSYYGGGVYVFAGGSFTLNGGMVTGNYVSGDGGGGVNCGGKFDMTAGTISSNRTNGSYHNGGGVYLTGNSTDHAEFTMSGGAITGNSAYHDSSKGGGVYMTGTSTFAMSGTAEISGNNARTDSCQGGGVYVNSGTFSVSGGATVTGNTMGSKDKTSNVFLYTDKHIDVTGALTGSIGVTPNSGSLVAEGSGYSLDYSDVEKMFHDAGTLDLILKDNQAILGTLTTVSDWAELKAALAKNGTVKLADDITAAAEDTALEVPENKTVTLDLNGHMLSRGLTNPKADGYVIKVLGDLTVIDNGKTQRYGQWTNDTTYELTTTAPAGTYDTFATGGVITGGYNNGNGGGVYVSGFSAKLTMTGGAIAGNRANYVGDGGDGGGVNVDGGSFIMSGSAAVSGNRAGSSCNGGGVYVSGSTAKLIMSGSASVSGNKTTSSFSMGGGVYVNSGSFSMSGSASVSGNTTEGRGGGVFTSLGGSFTMSGSASVSGNKAGDRGGGGGVYVSGGSASLTMSENASVSGNTAGGNGGGVDVDDGSFAMSGSAAVRGNTVPAGKNGGGVFVEGGAIEVSGNANVTGNVIGGTLNTNTGLYTGNTYNNVYLDRFNQNEIITVTGALTDGAGIGVTASYAGNNAVVAKAANTYNDGKLTAADVSKLSSDDGDYVVMLDTAGKAVLKEKVSVKTWAELKDAMEAGGSIKLAGDITATENDTALEVPADKTVILDLAGHTIDRALNEAKANGNVIKVSGNLTLTDSSADKTGVITGGKNALMPGGGVKVDGGTFTMEGGTIRGNTAEFGGGVDVSSNGSFTMTGGAITGNTANSCGGGVRAISATFTMSGGAITGNTAVVSGGGVYLDSANFAMSGSAEISGNNTGSDGGGVYWPSSFTNTTFTVSGGAKITGNVKNGTKNDAGVYTGGQASNLYLDEDKVITVTGALTDGAAIGVTAKGHGNGRVVAKALGGEDAYNGGKLKDSDAEKLTYDGGAYVIELNSDKQAVLKENPGWGWLQLKLSEASFASGSPTLITLPADITAAAGDVALELPAGRYAILDLAGHKIDRGLTTAVEDGYVIKVEGDLTLKDSSDKQTGVITGGNNKEMTGGGVYVPSGSLTMTGGTISGNKTEGWGGGVNVSAYGSGPNGSFTMTGGVIRDNTAEAGGGVAVADGSFTMSGDAVICDNTATQDGGGVEVATGGTFDMRGGAIRENKAAESGGVALSGGTFLASGGATVTGNTVGGQPSNVGTSTIIDSMVITVTGPLTGAIGVTDEAPADGRIVAVGSADPAYPLTAADVSHLVSDNGDYVVMLSEGKAVLKEKTEVSTWDDLKTKMAAGGAIKLAGNVTCDNPTAVGNYLSVPTGKTVVLDLNGHTLSRNLTEAIINGRVIEVEGDLTIADGSADKAGVITGGKNNSSGGGGVWVVGGSLTMTGGTIRGNKGLYGGGVDLGGNGGFFRMTGGAITGNTATELGGGVFITNNCSFEMSGGAITGNTTDGACGGVFVTNGSFAMSGDAEITGNNAGEDCGGVYVNYSESSPTTFTVSGNAKVTGNVIGGTLDPETGLYTGGKAGNVYLEENKTIIVTDALTGAVGVTAENPAAGVVVAACSADPAYTLTATDLAKLSYDGGAWAIALNGSKEAVLEETPWHALQRQLAAASEDKDNPTPIQLTQDVYAGEGDVGLVLAAGRYAVLDLAGHTIDRGLTTAVNYGYVIKVSGNLTLTDSSADKTGVITGGNTTNYGGGVYVSSGSLTMTGGTISGNKTTAWGGGVYVYNGNGPKGSFTMTGGVIRDNTAEAGGGVDVVNGSFTMSGDAVICGNTAEYGGGVDVAIGGTFDMRGGAIRGNKAAESGGVGLSGGTFLASGGATVTGNTVGGQPSNVGTSTIIDSMVITVTGPLTGAIGVTDEAPADGRIVAVGSADPAYTLTATDVAKLSYDGGAYGIMQSSGNQAILTGGFTVDDILAQTYSGSALTPAVTVRSGETILTVGTDYTVTYYKTVDDTLTKIDTITDVGDYTVRVTGAGNYAGTVDKPFAVGPLPVTVSGIKAASKDYDGTTAVTLSFADVKFNGDKTFPGLTVTAQGAFDGADAGAGKTVNITNIALAGATANFTLAGSGNQTTATADIRKITWPGPAAATTSVKRGNDGTFTLTGNYVAPGATFGDCAVDGALYNVSLDVSVLRFTAGNAVGTATITVPITDADNYKDYDFTLTVTITDKETQTLRFADAAPEKTWGDGDFTNALSGAVTPVRYAVTQDAYVVEVDAVTGAVHILGAGTAVITATAAETLEYAEASTSFTLTVLRKDVTVTADDLTKDYGAGDPPLTWTAEGLVNGDDESVLTVGISRAVGETAGASYVITPGGDAIQGNYNVSYLPGTLTIGEYHGGGVVYSGPTTYAAEIKPAEHGSVTVRPTSAQAGDAVTVTLIPDEGYEADGLTVTGPGGKSVEVTKNADGTYSFTQPDGKVTIAAAFKEKAPETPPAAEGLTIAELLKMFPDLDPKGWYLENVLWAVDNGVMQGTDKGFEPDAPTSRAMLVQMLWNMAGKPKAKAAAPFGDVSADAWYADAVAWAYEIGLVRGNGVGFGGDDPLTREQAAVILYNYAKYLGDGFQGMWAFRLDFPDVGEVSEWAVEAVSWMVMNGVINGSTDEGGNIILDPQGGATRAQIAAMVQRFCEKNKK